MRFLVILALVLAAGPAHADTLGYPRAMQLDEMVIAKPSGKPRVIVARTHAEWRAAWKTAGGKGPARAIDFSREMVVGVVNGKTDDRVIYRIQLDDAARAKALVVHLGAGDAPTWSGNTRPRVGAQFVVTPRSSLAVRFVFDEMVDARLFAFTNTKEGVDSKQISVVPGVTTTVRGKAALREDAERAVVTSLSAAERKQLLEGPLGRPLARIPHGWTDLEVVREPTRWKIRYDKLVFHVDAATGKVTH